MRNTSLRGAPDAGRAWPSPGAYVGSCERSPGAGVADVAAVSAVPVQMWQRRAQSRHRRGRRGERSPGTDVAAQLVDRLKARLSGDAQLESARARRDALPNHRLLARMRAAHDLDLPSNQFEAMSCLSSRGGLGRPVALPRIVASTRRLGGARGHCERLLRLALTGQRER